MDENCPNCAAKLEPFRTDRQRAGHQEAVLCWAICPRCRHVALHSWCFKGTAGESGDTSAEAEVRTSRRSYRATAGAHAAT